MKIKAARRQDPSWRQDSLAEGKSSVSDRGRLLSEAQLTSGEIERILRICGPRALLVGGQALAAWAVYYGVQPVGESSRAVTMDADFIGTKDTTEKSLTLVGGHSYAQVGDSR